MFMLIYSKITRLGDTSGISHMLCWLTKGKLEDRPVNIGYRVPSGEGEK